MTTSVALSPQLEKRLNIDKFSITEAKGSHFYDRLVRALNRSSLRKQILQLPADVSNISIYYAKPRQISVTSPSWGNPIEGLVAFITLNKGQGPHEVLDGALLPISISRWSLLPFSHRVKRAFSPVLEKARQKVPIFQQNVNREIQQLSRWIHELKAGMFFTMESMDTCRDQAERYQDKLEQERPGYEKLSRLLEHQRSVLHATDRQIRALEQEQRQRISEAESRRQQAQAEDLRRQYSQRIETALQQRRAQAELVEKTQAEIAEHPYRKVERILKVALPTEMNFRSLKLKGHKQEVAAYEHYIKALQA